MSKKLQKPTTKISADLHTEDWNSRFWVNNIPDIKPRSAAVNLNRNPWPIANRLPKIQSASSIGNHLTSNLLPEPACNPLVPDLNIKTQQIPEIKNPQS